MLRFGCGRSGPAHSSRSDRTKDSGRRLRRYVLAVTFVPRGARQRSYGWRFGAILLVVLAGCSTSTSPSAPVTSRSPSAARASTVSPGSTLPARWWSWVESAPAAHNPVDDPSGVDCGRGQLGDVWFLAGTHGGSAIRACTIPSGQNVYFPIINQICTVPVGQTSALAIRSCSARVDSVTASLDGKTLTPTAETSGGVFTFVARPRSSTGFAAGPHHAVVWGLWIGPLRLTRGHHTLLFDGRAGSFKTTVRYRLSVEASG
jgi:hypothetical protein